MIAHIVNLLINTLGISIVVKSQNSTLLILIRKVFIAQIRRIMVEPENKVVAEMSHSEWKKYIQGFQELKSLREEINKFKNMSIIQFIKFKLKKN